MTSKSFNDSGLHGNTGVYGRLFAYCEVGGSFDLPHHDLAKANNARQHYTMRQWRLHRKDVKFTSKKVMRGGQAYSRFTRIR